MAPVPGLDEGGIALSEGKNWREQAERDDKRAIQEGLNELGPVRLGMVTRANMPNVTWNGMGEAEEPDAGALPGWRIDDLPDGKPD